MSDVDLRAILDLVHQGQVIGEDTVNKIFDSLKERLYRENTLLVLFSPIVICGDIHGQLEDLIYLFQVAGVRDRFDETSPQFLFMGDYVDRGHFSLNTFLLLAIYKLQFPDKVWLLRGNHECRSTSQQYGFHTEILTHYGHTALWTKCMAVFDLLPLAALVDGRVLSMHGGLSPNVALVADVNGLKRGYEIPEAGPEADLTWSDPEEQMGLTWRPNGRGAGYIFGKEIVIKFTLLNRLQLITRSHQLVQEGFRWYFKNDQNRAEEGGRLINVWSAPNYSYTSGNVATVLRLGFPGHERYHLPIFQQAKQLTNHQSPEYDSQYFA
jgi:diadenosine tetraphosphatase ApaH/serine/threonine PP2A family protein phosphatase